jgi:uncharacterized Tic20 family protein
MDTTSPPKLPIGNDKIWSILCHLSGFIGVPFILPLVIYLAMRRESAYVGQNAVSALNFHLSLLIYGLCCVPFVFIFIGIPLLIILALISLVLSIIAAVKASDGEIYQYPLAIRFLK